MRCLLHENALRSLLSTCVTTYHVATWAVLPLCEGLKNNSANDVKRCFPDSIICAQTTLRKPSASPLFFCGSTDIFYNDIFYLHRILEGGLIVQQFGLTVRLIYHIYENYVDYKM